MDDIKNILMNRDFDIPPEVRALKEYITRHYAAQVSVTVDKRTLIIRHKSAALIGTLRTNSATLQKASGSDKSISFRIG